MILLLLLLVLLLVWSHGAWGMIGGSVILHFLCRCRIAPTDDYGLWAKVGSRQAVYRSSIDLLDWCWCNGRTRTVV